MTVGLNIWVTVAIIGIAPIYSAMLSVPNVMLSSAMACLVFRGVIKGTISTSNGTNMSPCSTIPSCQPGANVYALNLRRPSKNTLNTDKHDKVDAPFNQV
jgi:hypothetical protein